MEERDTHGIQREEGGIDLGRVLRSFFRTARRWWPLAAVLMLALGGLRYARARLSYRPTYTAAATFSVTCGVDDTTDLLGGSSYYNAQAAQQLVQTFPYIIRSEAMTERIKATLGRDSLGGTVNTPQVIGNSNFYILSATSTDSQTALELLQAVIENYPQVASFVVGSTRLSMIKEPVLPTVPDSPMPGFGTAVKGALQGAVLGCVILLLMSLGRVTVLSPGDLQREVSLRCLGQIPEVRRHKRRKTGAERVSLLDTNQRTRLADPFSALRARLLRELETENDRMILVTSTLPGEGKTTVSFNLALSLAQSGKSVILVDADLRNQQMRERFGMEDVSLGLTELIRDKSIDPEEALISVGDTGLRVLAGSTRVPRAMDLLDSGRTRHILDRLRELADYVVIDAPPAGILEDAAVLGRSADRTLYVVRYDAVLRQTVCDSILGLSRRNVALCGYVLNRMPAQHKSSGYGYGYGYGYGKEYGRYGERNRN